MTERRRYGACSRETRETRVHVEVTLDDASGADATTGIGFFDHMLDQLSFHGGFRLQLACQGDLHVDGHHTVEDSAIALGQAFRQALGDCSGIRRYGHAIVPMDEALALCAVDVSGRGMCFMIMPDTAERVGDFEVCLVREFFRAFAAHAGITTHIRVLAGENTHHVVEAMFKAAGRALRQAVEVAAPDTGAPSTKGML